MDTKHKPGPEQVWKGREDGKPVPSQCRCLLLWLLLLWLLQQMPVIGGLHQSPFSASKTAQPSRQQPEGTKADLWALVSATRMCCAVHSWPPTEAARTLQETQRPSSLHILSASTGPGCHMHWGLCWAIAEEPVGMTKPPSPPQIYCILFVLNLLGLHIYIYATIQPFNRLSNW